MLFRRIGHKFGESFSNALLPAKGFTFLKECFIKRGYFPGQGFNLQQQPVVVSPQACNLLLQQLYNFILLHSVKILKNSVLRKK